MEFWRSNLWFRDPKIYIFNKIYREPNNGLETKGSHNGIPAKITMVRKLFLLFNNKNKWKFIRFETKFIVLNKKWLIMRKEKNYSSDHYENVQ